MEHLPHLTLSLNAAPAQLYSLSLYIVPTSLSMVLDLHKHADYFFKTL